ncbi:hypothetical protein EST38_g11378 [Candolleomyces aberdarensis]|uniref:Uncharacterized protein n=1 Tax=Candolleomyces aberdarensis TaxID=2316362 RepID=A0A4Q2D6I8_9AGAR|nr:hypothetical protein EST38_g11378 [Candolleomyces aberdarensis]
MTDRLPLDDLSLNALDDCTQTEDAAAASRLPREEEEFTSEHTRNDASEDANQQEKENLPSKAPRSLRQTRGLSQDAITTATGGFFDAVAATHPVSSATQTSAQSTSPSANEVSSRNKRRRSEENDQSDDSKDAESSMENQRPQYRRRLESSSSSIEFPSVPADAPALSSDSAEHTETPPHTSLTCAPDSGRRRLNAILPNPTPIAQNSVAARSVTTESHTSEDLVSTTTGNVSGTQTSDADATVSDTSDDVPNSQAPNLDENSALEAAVASASSSSSSLEAHGAASAPLIRSTSGVLVTPEIIEEYADRYYALQISRPRTSSGSGSNTPTPAPAELIIGDGLLRFRAQDPTEKPSTSYKTRAKGNKRPKTQIPKDSLRKDALVRAAAGSSASTPVAGGSNVSTAQMSDQAPLLTQSFSNSQGVASLQLDSYPQLSHPTEQAAASTSTAAESHPELSTHTFAQSHLPPNLSIGSTPAGFYFYPNVRINFHAQGDASGSSASEINQEVDFHTQAAPFGYDNPGVPDFLSVQNYPTLGTNDATSLSNWDFTNAQTDPGQSLGFTNWPGYNNPIDPNLGPFPIVDDFTSPLTADSTQYSHLGDDSGQGYRDGTHQSHNSETGTVENGDPYVNLELLKEGISIMDQGKLLIAQSESEGLEELERRGQEMWDEGAEVLLRAGPLPASERATGNHTFDGSTQQDVAVLPHLLPQPFVSYGYHSSAYLPQPIASTSQLPNLPPALPSVNPPILSQPPDDGRYRCPFCFKSYTTMGSVRRHVKRVVSASDGQCSPPDNWMDFL